MNIQNAAPLGDRPTLPAHLKKNFLLLAPLQTHWRPATCDEVRCDRFVNGYEIRLDTGDTSPMGVARLQYLRSGDHGLRFVEYRQEGTNWAVFRFPAGQRVIGHERRHRTRIDRPEVFAVRDHETGLYVHNGRNNGADNWVDQFANHQDKLADKAKEG